MHQSSAAQQRANEHEFAGASAQGSKVLVEEISGLTLPHEGKPQESSQPVLEQVDSTIAQPDQQQHQAAAGLLQSGNEEQSSQLGIRIQALEASSRRMERKVDQILEYCRVMAQSMAPS